MTKVSELTQEDLGEVIRVHGVEGVLENMWVSHSADTTFYYDKEDPDVDFNESTYLWIRGHGDWVEVKANDEVQFERVGYVPVFQSAEGTANIMSEVYELEERANENSVDGDKIAEVRFFA